ncbi:MAG: LysR family transcriptional regulator [Myxococcota bacterium]
MDWRDLRYALALGQHTSLKRAGAALGVDSTTVSRRIQALEAELGATLFVRTRNRWRPTAAGEAVLTRCERMAQQVRALRHDVDRASGQVHGKVRLTAINAVFTTWLVPHMDGLRRRYPDLEIELFATNAIVDLFKGQADVALRLKPPTKAGLVTKRLTTIPMVVAGRPELAARPPQERPVILIGFLDSETPENHAVKACGGTVACTATSFSVVVSLVREGLGIGALPREMALVEGLTILNHDVGTRRIWRAVPEEIAHAPRIRAVTDWLDAVFDPGTPSP